MSNTTDNAELAQVLRSSLAELLLQAEEPTIASADDIENGRDFREYGLTSVDFLEFVLTLETKLETTIPDEAFTEVSLLTVDDWVEYLTK